MIDHETGEPVSWVIRAASSLALPWRMPLSLVISSERSGAVVFDHGPSKALRAASTARSMSPVEPSGAVPSTSSVAASMTSMRPEPAGATHCPSMKSLSLVIMGTSPWGRGSVSVDATARGGTCSTWPSAGMWTVVVDPPQQPSRTRRLRHGLVDAGQDVVGEEGHGGEGSHVLLDLLDPAGAGDDRGDVRVGDAPGEGQLGERDAELV